ncbi:hypothetical protein [Micromonospora sp. NPDC049102]|uniref:hypothetical protein n=1 Tax=Micromonospora sp. NPDC049102 TaxID=3364265 RepID=UPI003718221D
MQATQVQQSVPGAVRNAFRLTLLVIGLALLSNVVSLFDGGREEAEAAGTGAVWGAVAFAVVLVILQFLVAFKMRAGARWARTVLTILAVLQLIGTVVGLADVEGGFGTVHLVLNVLVAIIDIAVLVLLYRPESNRYFAR